MPNATRSDILRAICLLLLIGAQAGSGAPEPDILKRVMDRIKENDKIAEDFGYYYQATFRDLDDESRIKKEEKRLYHVIWLEDKAYFELLKINDGPLTPKQKSDELKRREKFIKSVHEKAPPEFKMDWDEVFAKYDYTVLPGEGTAVHLVTFQPKKSGLKERSRMEKVFNHIAGKVWIDADCNVTRANLWLADEVRFGLGILGSLDELELQYSQQSFESRVWLPTNLRITYNLRVLVKDSRQQMESRFYDFYPRPAETSKPGQH